MSTEITETKTQVDESKVPPLPKVPVRRYIQQFAMLFALALIMIVTSSLSPNFFTTANMLNVARQIALTAIMGAGMTVVIISGGIDLSVGGVIALGGAVVANVLIATNGNIWLATLAGLGVGAAVGLGNGLVISKLGIQPFIVTLASMTITRGIVLIYTNAIPISVLKYTDFKFFGQGYFGPEILRRLLGSLAQCGEESAIEGGHCVGYPHLLTGACTR